MKSFEKETIQAQLKDEDKCLKDLEKAYKQAKKDCQQKLRNLNSRKDMHNLQSVIHQKKYQEALLKQIDGVLNDLQTHTYKTANDFFQGSYQNGYIGSMYELQKQGIPMTIPVSTKKMVTAIQTKSKLSQSYYEKQGLTIQNIRTLKKQIALEATRGIASGKSWLTVADSLTIQRYFDISRSDAMRIVRTEGNRINQQARLDAGDEAVQNGCDLLKQWDATLDSVTRPAHREADGQIVEWNEKFTVMGEKLDAPSIGGSASNVINCRCQLLKRPRWSLDEEELEVLKQRASYYGLDKTKSFEEYKEKFLKIPDVPTVPIQEGSFDDQLKNADQEFKRLKNERYERTDELKRVSEDIDVYDRGLRRGYSTLDEFQSLDELKARKAEVLQLINQQSYSRPSRSLQVEYMKLTKGELEWDNIIKYRKVRDLGIDTLRKQKDDLENLLKGLVKQMDDKLEEIRSLKIMMGDETMLKVLKTPIDSNDSQIKRIVTSLKNLNVDYNPVLAYPVEQTEEDIIDLLAGGDQTRGSCASLGLAYIGRKQGWDVLDFRDGNSRHCFSIAGNLLNLSKMEGMSALRYGDVAGKSSCTIANNFLKTCEVGKEYYLCTGRHASIVRKTKEGKLQYLELQSASDSGWTDFNGNPRYTLTNRFGCSSSSGHGEQFDFMLNITDSDFSTDDFRSLLGFINTDKDKQVKGQSGTIK